jgi:hypothetical protein
MNPALASLLSALCDGALAPAHRADLAASALTPETIRAYAIRSVPPEREPRKKRVVAPSTGHDTF